MNDEDRMWRRRFLVMNLARLSGVLMVLLGLAITFGDLVTPGGSKLIGSLVIAAGMTDMILAPMLLRKAWRHP